jgi:hypothetical protein
MGLSRLEVWIGVGATDVRNPEAFFQRSRASRDVIMAQIQTLKDSDYQDAARDLGVDVAVVHAVTAVEARGTGFIKGTDLPIILFEGHQYHRRTNGRYSRDYPNISYPKWDRSKYKGGRGEYDRLTLAIRVHGGNPEPALMATSWGLFQIMGFNHAQVGYGSVVDFVNAMAESEGAQLRAFVAFIRTAGLADELRRHDWAAFAKAYNGAGYRANKYDSKLAAAFASARARKQDEMAGLPPDMDRSDAVELQVALNAALGGALPEKLATDGWIGDKTTLAIRLFQRENGLEDSGEVDAKLKQLLGLEPQQTALAMEAA